MAKPPTSFYIDPTKRTGVMEEYGVRTLPEFQGSAYHLRDVPDYSDLQQSAIDYGRHSDLFTLLMGGFPAADVAQDFTGGEMIDTGGEGGIPDAGAVQPTSDGAQNPLTQMITTPEGETMTVKEAMTSDEAYSLDDPYTILGEEEYIPTYAEQLQDLQGETPVTGDIQVEDLTTGVEPYAITGAAPLPDQTGTIPAAPEIFDIEETGDPTGGMLDVMDPDVGLAYQGEFDPDDEGTVYSDEAGADYEKVESGEMSKENYLTKYGPVIYNLAKENFIAAGLGLLSPITAAGAVAADVLPEWSEADIAAQQYAKTTPEFDPSGSLGKDEFGLNTRTTDGKTYVEKVQERQEELNDIIADQKAAGTFEEGSWHDRQFKHNENVLREQGVTPAVAETETIYGDQPVTPGTVFDAEDYGDPSIVDAPDLVEPAAPEVIDQEPLDIEDFLDVTEPVTAVDTAATEDIITEPTVEETAAREDIEPAAPIYTEPTITDYEEEAAGEDIYGPTYDMADIVGEEEPVTFTTEEGKAFDPSTEENLSDLNLLSEDDYAEVKEIYLNDPNLTIINNKPGTLHYGKKVSAATGELVGSEAHKEKLETGTESFAKTTAAEPATVAETAAMEEDIVSEPVLGPLDSRQNEIMHLERLRDSLGQHGMLQQQGKVIEDLELKEEELKQSARGMIETAHEAGDLEEKAETDASTSNAVKILATKYDEEVAAGTREGFDYTDADKARAMTNIETAAEKRAAEQAEAQRVMQEQIRIAEEAAAPAPADTGGDGGGPDYGPYTAPSPAPSPPSGNGGGGNGCFLPDTPITMANGSTKPVKDVDIGDEVAKGGKVFAAGRFLINNLYDYKGIKVSGSHMVNEDGKWTRIEDSKHGKPLGNDEHIVYVFGAENRRILINNILFTDYFEVREQDELFTKGNKYFKEWKEHKKIFMKLEEKHNVAMLNS